MEEFWDAKTQIAFLALVVAGYAGIVATYAACVSTAQLLWNIYIGRRDSPQLHVKLTSGEMLMGPGATVSNLLILEAANRGRRPVTITSYVFELSDGRSWAFMPYSAAPLPKRLEEGESYTNWFSLRTLQESVQKEPPNIRITALAFRTADGRSFRRKIGRRDPWQKVLRGPLAPPSKNLDLLDPQKPMRELAKQMAGMR